MNETCGSRGVTPLAGGSGRAESSHGGLAPEPPLKGVTPLRIPISIFLLGILALAALYLTGLGSYGLIETTEARYSAIAAAMHDSGDYTIPRVDGFVHLHKPPLVYWIGALGMSIAGRSELGGRLPQVVVLLLTLLTLIYTLSRLSDQRTGLLAAWMLATTVLAVGGCRGLNTDILVLFSVTLALCGDLLHRLEDRRRYRLAFWLGLAVGMLAKGPVPVLTVALVILAERFLPGEKLPARSLGWLWGLPLFLLINLPWYGFVLNSLPGLLDYFIHDQLLSRVGGSGEGHPRPFLFYLYVFPLAAFPWSVFFLDRQLHSRSFYNEPMKRFFLLWLLVPLVFFSLPKTKLPLYVIGALSPLAALVALRFAASLRGEEPVSRGTVEFLLGIGGVLTAGLFAYASWRMGRIPAVADACLHASLLLFVAWGVLSYARKHENLLYIVAGTGLLTVALVVGAFWNISGLEGKQLRTVRPLARTIQTIAGDQQFTLFQYRTFQAGFSFYLQQPAVFVNYERNLRFDPPETASRLLPDLAALQQKLPDYKGLRFLVSPAGNLAELASLNGTILHQDRHLVLLQLP